MSEQIAGVRYLAHVAEITVFLEAIRDMAEVQRIAQTWLVTRGEWNVQVSVSRVIQAQREIPACRVSLRCDNAWGKGVAVAEVRDLMDLLLSGMPKSRIVVEMPDAAVSTFVIGQ